MDKIDDQPATTQDVYNLLKNIDNKLAKKIDEVQEEVRSLRISVNEDIGVLKEKVNCLEEQNSLLKEKLKYIERKNKQNSVIIYGLEEQEGENQSKLLEEILKLINSIIKVELVPFEINNIYRIGKNVNTRRPILVSFVTTLKKQEVIRNGKRLKGTEISISEDLIDEDREERKILVEALKQARNQNKKAVIRGNRIIIDSTKFSATDILNDKHKNNFEFSPPPQRKTSSEPTTPSLKEIEFESDTDIEIEKQKLEDENKNTEIAKNNQIRQVKEVKDNQQKTIQKETITRNAKTLKNEQAKKSARLALKSSSGTPKSVVSSLKH